MSELKLKAKTRKEFGRKVKSLRREGVLPANIYGRKVKSQAVSVDLSEFVKLFGQAGQTSIVDLIVDGKTKPILIHNVQKDPVTDIAIHADFLQVDLKQKVTSQIPIELIAESPAEKQGLGTVVQYIDEIEVEALPTDLPEKFEIDLSILEKVDDQIQVKNVKVDVTKVKVQNEPEQIIVKVEPLREEKEEVAKPEEKEEGEEEKEEKEEGEEVAPQEGEKEIKKEEH